MNNIVTEILIALVLTALIALLTFAHSTWMPDMTTMLLLVLIVVSFFAVAVFFWKERGGDERDMLIRYIGARSAFLATGVVLLAGIVFETLIYHAPSPWLGLALVAMVSGKIIGHAYGHKKY